MLISFTQPDEQQSDESVTKEQFIKFIIGDVPNPMEVARQLGLVQGDGSGNYYEEKIITREEVAVILDRFVLLYGIELEEKEVAIRDEKDIGPWAVNSVRKLVSSGIIKLDSDGKFNPKGDATESFVFTVLNELIDRLLR